MLAKGLTFRQRIRGRKHMTFDSPDPGLDGSLGRFDELIRALDCDALLAATGGQDQAGEFMITDVICNYRVDPRFIDEYRDHARRDVVGQLFLADSRIVECVSVDDYDVGLPVTHKKGSPKYVESRAQEEAEKVEKAEQQARGDRRRFRDYLLDWNFAHLVIAGLSSSYGVAWVTAYRKTGRPAFKPADVELFRYEVPSLLFRWQSKHVTTRSLPERAAVLVPLTSDQLRRAILEAEGYGPAAIGRIVHKSAGTINNQLAEIRKTFGVRGRRLTLKDLEWYAGHSSELRRK